MNAVCIDLKNRVVGYYDEKNDPATIAVKKLKSKVDINAIIEAKSLAFCDSIFPSDFDVLSLNFAIIIPDDYKYSQRLELYDFCKTQKDIAFFRMISTTRALALSIDTDCDKTVVCVDYNNDTLSCCGLDYGDEVYNIFETFFISCNKNETTSIAEKFKKSMKDTCDHNTTRLHYHTQLQHYTEAYFSSNNPFMQDVREYFKSLGVIKMRTVSDDDIIENVLLWLSGIRSHLGKAKNQHIKLLLDSVPYEINTANEVAIQKDTTFPTSHTEKLTTVKNEQKTADIPFIVNYLGLNYSELVGLYSAKIDSAKKTEEEIIEIETGCDADGIISINASMKNNQKTIHYHLTGPLQGFGKDGSK